MYCRGAPAPLFQPHEPSREAAVLEDGVDGLGLRAREQESIVSSVCGCLLRCAQTRARRPSEPTSPRKSDIARERERDRERAADAPRGSRRRQSPHRLPSQYPSVSQTCVASWAARRARARAPAAGTLLAPRGRSTRSSRRTPAAAGTRTRRPRARLRSRRARARAGPTRTTSRCGSLGAGRGRGRGRARARGTRCARRAAEEEEERVS